MRAEEQGLVRSLMAAWGFREDEIGRITPILDVYRVETASGPKNLKWTRLPDEKLEFIVNALAYLWEHGFEGLSLPSPTTDGRPFLVREGQHYLLSEWIEGEQADLSRPEELAAACRTLARFHRASRGYRAPAQTMARPYWHQWPANIATRQRSLQELVAKAADAPPQSRFDAEMLNESAYYATLGGYSLARLQASPYEALARGAELEGSLCHGDVAARNFVRTPPGELYLIDFDGLRQDLPLIDLWKMYRRIMKSLHWESEAGLLVIASYEEIRPLSPGELEVLASLLAFPQKFWRLSDRYYRGYSRISEESYYRKLRKFTRERQAHAIFLERLIALCRERGACAGWPPLPLAMILSGSEDRP